MRGDADVQPRHPAGAFTFGQLHRRFERADLTGNDRLPRTVAIGRHHDPVSRRYAADLRDCFIVQSQHRGHATGIVLASLLHQTTTFTHQRKGGRELHDPRRHQRGELAEGVPGHIVGRQGYARLFGVLVEGRQRSDAHRENGGLRVDRIFQHSAGPF
ncbi:MAG: hypothetical protein R2848_18970 [Thermomicrobiales bacterium]